MKSLNLYIEDINVIVTQLNIIDRDEKKKLIERSTTKIPGKDTHLWYWQTRGQAQTNNNCVTLKDFKKIYKNFVWPSQTLSLCLILTFESLT